VQRVEEDLRATRLTRGLVLLDGYGHSELHFIPYIFSASRGPHDEGFLRTTNPRDPGWLKKYGMQQ
jgi:hypothetical protein